jgi:hypothetical protein
LSSSTVDPPAGEVLVAYKRAQVLLSPDREVRFAGPVRTSLPYRVDDIFVCPRGHRRLVPACSCGFYAIEDRERIRPSVVCTALLEVGLQGRVVRHPDCVRGERQQIRSITFDGWCSFCIAPAVGAAGITPAWSELPPPWRRAVPVCDTHAPLYPLVVSIDWIATATGAAVSFDRSSVSRAARSLARIYGRSA